VCVYQRLQLASEAGVKPLDYQSDVSTVLYSALQTSAALFNRFDFLEVCLHV
jgi:hypothetical protein